MKQKPTYNEAWQNELFNAAYDGYIASDNLKRETRDCELGYLYFAFGDCEFEYDFFKDSEYALTPESVKEMLEEAGLDHDPRAVYDIIMAAESYFYSTYDFYDGERCDPDDDPEYYCFYNDRDEC